MTAVDPDLRIEQLVARLELDLADERVSWERTLGPVPPSDEEVRAWGEDAIIHVLERLELEMAAQGEPRLSDDAEDRLSDELRSRVFGLGALDALLADPLVENIVANGCDQVTVTYAGGKRRAGPPLADSDRQLEQLIRRLAGSIGRTERRFDDEMPFLDLRLTDGSRLHAVKLVTERPCISIRRHRFLQITLDELHRLGTIDLGLRHLLGAAVAPPHPVNIVVAGGTDSGKTTFLRGLLSAVPVEERLVVVEDNTELQLSADPARERFVVEMETRAPNVEGVGAITMADLLKQSLRMRPDRVIVGEIRGGEAADMFKAMSTGNDGSLSTLHADSALNAIAKMQLYGQMADEPLTQEASAQLIAQSIHLVVHLRKMDNGTRTVSSVLEVTGSQEATVQSNELYASGPDGRAVPTDVQCTERLVERLAASGFDGETFRSGAGVWAT